MKFLNPEIIDLEQKRTSFDKNIITSDLSSKTDGDDFQVWRSSQGIEEGQSEIPQSYMNDVQLRDS